MQSPRFVRSALLLSVVLLVSSPAGAQIGDLGKIIAKKDKDAADAVDKAGKTTGSARPVTKTPPRSRVQPVSPTGEYSPDTEDPMSVLEISAESLVLFSAGIAAEKNLREAPGKAMTIAKYHAAGAESAQMTPRQYFVFGKRVTPFCEALARGAERPDDGRLGYMPSEVDALRSRCKSVLPAIEELATLAQRSPPVTTKKKK